MWNKFGTPGIGTDSDCYREQLKKAINEHDRMQAALDGIPLDRLEQLCQAEREGRCVVLPCKVGATVWVSPNNGKSFHTGKLYGVNERGSYLVFVGDDVKDLVDHPLGRHFFDWFGRVYTREAAEAALKEAVV